MIYQTGDGRLKIKQKEMGDEVNPAIGLALRDLIEKVGYQKALKALTAPPKKAAVSMKEFGVSVQQCGYLGVICFKIEFLTLRILRLFAAISFEGLSAQAEGPFFACL